MIKWGGINAFKLNNTVNITSSLDLFIFVLFYILASWHPFVKLRHYQIRRNTLTLDAAARSAAWEVL